MIINHLGRLYYTMPLEQYQYGKHFKKKASHQSQIKFLLNLMSSPIITSWKDVVEIQRQLINSYQKFQQVRPNTTNFRKPNLL